MKKHNTKNAIVIMFDSLQYNYLACNGNTWIKTPNFDRFAREGIIFDNCYTEGLPTVPCRRAMHTGRYTLPVKGWSPLDMEDTTIADLCWGRPIDTALYFDCPMYRLPKFGYTRSFDKVWFLHGHEGDQGYYRNKELIHYKAEDFFPDYVKKSFQTVTDANIYAAALDEAECYLKNRQYWKGEEDQNVAVLMKNAVEYLENLDRTQSFFMWIDSFDPHEPWDPPSVYNAEINCPYDPDYDDVDLFIPANGEATLYREKDLNHIRMLYAEKITMCDNWLGYFMENFKRLGLEDDTMIMIVSDHGEPLGHAEHGHGIMRKCRPWPYEELVHSVMMLRGPDLPNNKRISAFTQSVDVAPTICDWLGIGVHPDHQGFSLLPLVRDEIAKVRDFAIAGYYKYSWSIITEDWSYIHWLRQEEASIYADVHGIYRSEVGSSNAHLGGTNITPLKINPEAQKMAEFTSLDGEDQWTCTPTSKVELPARDELYSRATDKAQLHNVIDTQKEVAIDLLQKLKTFMSTIKAS